LENVYFSIKKCFGNCQKNHFAKQQTFSSWNDEKIFSVLILKEKQTSPVSFGYIQNSLFTGSTKLS